MLSLQLSSSPSSRIECANFDVQLVGCSKEGPPRKAQQVERASDTDAKLPLTRPSHPITALNHRQPTRY